MAWHISFELENYPGPEECSIAWVFVNAFVDSRQTLSCVKRAAQGLWNVDVLSETFVTRKGSWSIQRKALNFNEFKYGGLHEKHAVATRNSGAISAFV
jgi:hypothetical protein